MSLSMKLSDLQTHVTELAESIAHDLDVNASQVHLWSATEKENDSLVKWAILPVASSIISNTTIMDGYFPALGTRMQLPNTLSSLLRLHVTADFVLAEYDKSTWRQRHYLAVVLINVFVMLITLLNLGVWFIWRKGQQCITAYKPTDAAFQSKNYSHYNICPA